MWTYRQTAWTHLWLLPAREAAQKEGQLEPRGYIEAASGSSRLKNREYRDAVESFIALEAILEPACNETDRDILRPLAINTRGRRYRKNPAKLAPVQKVVHAISMRRAEKCMPIWLEQFQAAYKELPAMIKERAEYMLKFFDRKAATLSRRQQMEKLIACGFLDDDYGKPSKEIRDEIYAHVEHLSRREYYKCHFRRMPSQYLVEPCQVYSAKLLDSVGEARYDTKMYKNGVGPIAMVTIVQGHAKHSYVRLLKRRRLYRASDHHLVASPG